MGLAAKAKLVHAYRPGEFHTALSRMALLNVPFDVSQREILFSLFGVDGLKLVE